VEVDLEPREEMRRADGIDGRHDRPRALPGGRAITCKSARFRSSWPEERKQQDHARNG
jgi:hypothetical protein